MGVVLGMFMLILGITCVHLAGTENVIEEGQQFLLIGTAIFTYILGALVLNHELRELND